MSKYTFQRLTSFDLKMIALATMLIDHVGYVFFSDIILLKIIGRIAFVIFSFLLVEGFVHTKNRITYLKKMGIWALISELPYDLAINGQWIDFTSQNIFFSLLFGLICLFILESSLPIIFKVVAVASMIILATGLRFDFSYLGIVQIIVFYIFRRLKFIKNISIALLNAFVFGKISTQAFAILGLIPLAMYNGKRGPKTGDIFYSFYSVHLLIIGLIKFYIL